MAATLRSTALRAIVDEYRSEDDDADADAADLLLALLSADGDAVRIRSWIQENLGRIDGPSGICDDYALTPFEGEIYDLHYAMITPSELLQRPWDAVPATERKKTLKRIAELARKLGEELGGKSKTEARPPIIGMSSLLSGRIVTACRTPDVCRGRGTVGPYNDCMECAANDESQEWPTLLENLAKIATSKIDLPAEETRPNHPRLELRAWYRHLKQHFELRFGVVPWTELERCGTLAFPHDVEHLPDSKMLRKWLT